MGGRGAAVMGVAPSRVLREALREHSRSNAPNKIKVKIADVEFEAEGSPDVVQAQYDKFLEMIDKMTELRKLETGFDPKARKG